MNRALPMLELAAPTRAPVSPPATPARLAEFATDDVALPRFHIWTLGCQMNRSDSEEMAGALAAAGCQESADLESADLIVINTCAIREAAEQKVVGRMGQLDQLKQLNPALRVVLTGCSVRADNSTTLRRRYPAVDLFLRPDEEPELAARLGLAGPTAPGLLAAGGMEPTFQRVGRSITATADRLPLSRAAAVSAGHVRREGSTSAWLPIIYGCDKTCTYCIVPFSRGPERSRPFDDIVEEARQLAAMGYREVTLLGQNVNSYGHDLPPEDRFRDVHGERRLGRRLALDGKPDIAALLRAIDGLRTADGAPAISRLRFVTSHPWDLSERLISAMAECSSVCEHLHLPVQSGDDAVLHRMGRQYTVEAYLALVEQLRAAIPEICLTTDVIVGFCGETEAAFERTLDLLRTVRFEQVFAAAFSPRPGTPAARLPDDVPRDEKKRRLQALLELQEQLGLEANRNWEGRTTDVLVDQTRPAPAHDHGEPGPPRLAGRNRQNKLVHLEGPPDLLGSMVSVQVERAGPYALVGSRVD
ncbi:MAG: MiaB/RimO family radical SAM methylthiotransferase [Chloroflexota bacterium]|nr:MiaB/RimO family radical SAM methylthiotransferase [Chloroflexota bacterium]